MVFITYATWPVSGDTMAKFADASAKIPPPPPDMKVTAHGPYTFGVENAGGGAITVFEVDDSQAVDAIDGITSVNNLFAREIPGFTYRLIPAYSQQDVDRMTAKFPLQ